MIRRYLLLCLFGIVFAGDVAAQDDAGMSNAQLASAVCANLALETQAVLNDAGDTHKYLSPYIAQDLYQGVIHRTMAALPAVAAAHVVVPEMSTLPCQDTVSDFMMGIKQRMEYGRFDRMLLDNRVRIALFGFLAVAGFTAYWRWWRRPKTTGSA